MNNKPEWNTAPEWANWLACDEDGDWWWFENRPFYRDYKEGVTCWKENGGQYVLCPAVEYPENTLEGRLDE